MLYQWIWNLHAIKISKNIYVITKQILLKENESKFSYHLNLCKTRSGKRTVFFTFLKVKARQQQGEQEGENTRKSPPGQVVKCRQACCDYQAAQHRDYSRMGSIM